MQTINEIAPLDDEAIAVEAYRLWQADGSPLWGRPEDHWMRAIEGLKRRAQMGAGAPLEDATLAGGAKD